MWAIFKRVMISVVRLCVRLYSVQSGRFVYDVWFDFVGGIHFVPDKTMTSIFTSLWHAKSHTSRYLAQNKVIKFIMSIVLAMSNSTLYFIALCLVFFRLSRHKAQVHAIIFELLTKSIFLFIKKWLIFNLYWWPIRHEHSSQSQEPNNQKSLAVRPKPCHLFIDQKLWILLLFVCVCVCVFVNINWVLPVSSTI